ncbi:MAG TPA: penicillin-binding transpeptidase domain-containing protein [Candidatus Limnocylindrales bacterium]|nr:penicillin-binding transpeptidase domain-containing protein [Candidatus Limnocylindrales bacterium]
MQATATGSASGRRPLGRTIGHVGLALTVAFAGLALGAGYWQVLRSADLSRAPDNPAVIAAARNVVRGQIVDRNGKVLATTRRDKNGEPYRVYADRSFSTVIGYASQQFGTAGLERAWNAELTGASNGNPIGDALRKFQRNPYDPQKLTLGISSALQDAAVKGLGSDRGAVVMIDPQTGQILALASTPTYDASAIANPATQAQGFAAARDNKAQPLLTRATQGRYVPGSVFKVVTAIAGLGSGRITPDTTYPQQPKAEKDGLLVSGFRVHEHPGVPAETFNLTSATEWSSNIWYALTGLRTGGDNLASFAARMGFGKRIDFDLPTEPSQVTNPGGSGPGGFRDQVELANASYGQAATLVTPLQMALVASTVANQGTLMKPHLVISTAGRDGTHNVAPAELGRVIAPDEASAIAAAMQAAVESPIGRQFTTGAKVPGIPTAGKSGTAELGGSGAPHSWFIGFAPVDHPRIAIAVIVERGGRGGARAAPLAGDLMTLFFKQGGS